MPGNERMFAGIATAAILALAVTMIIVAVAYSPYGQSTRGANASYITVTASGSVSQTPQQADVYLTANGTAENAANATAMLAQTIGRINSTVSRYLINGSSIQTTSYQLYRPYNSIYYTASESLTLSFPFNATGSAIAALSSVNNTFISGISIQLSQPQAAGMSSSALAMAMQNATAQAQEVAGTNAKLNVVSVTVNNAGYILPGPKFSVASDAVPVFPGTQSVTQSVTVKYSYVS